jgi:scyllo-inositol 2-dehydrogenase (NADP+)
MIRVGVIGAGWVTPHRHIPALLRSGRCQVVGVIDRHEERAKAVRDRFDLPNFGTGLDAPWLESVTAVTIGVSPMHHFEVASALLERGKHVLLEKPMCLTLAEGEELAARARAGNLVLAVVHNFQFSHAATRARAMLASGRWGKLTGLHGFQLSSVRRRLPTWYEELPFGLFYDEAPHLLYLLQTFGGPLEVCRASAVPSTLGQVTPSVIQAELRAGGLPATLELNFEAPISEWQLLLHTEAGMAAYDLFRDILIFVPCDHRHEARNVLRSSWALLWGHAAGFVRSGLRMLTGRLLYGNEEVVRRFLDAVEGRAPLRDIDADSGLAILRVQHAILDRAQAKGPP